MDSTHGMGSAFDLTGLELGLQELETLEAPSGFWTWAGRVVGATVVIATATVAT